MVAVKIVPQKLMISWVQLKNSWRDVQLFFPIVYLYPGCRLLSVFSFSLTVITFWHSPISMPWQHRKTSDSPWQGGPGVEKAETSQAVFESSFPRRKACIAMYRQWSSASSLASRQCVTPKSWSWTLPSSLFILCSVTLHFFQIRFWNTNLLNVL